MLGRVAAVVIAFLSAIPAFAQCNYTPVRSAQFRSSALDLAIDGNDLWVATSYGVSLYDRSVDPPKLAATLAVPGTTRVIRAQGGFAYAGSGSSLVVIQKSGAHSLTIVRTLDAGAQINDIAATPVDLYVATNGGIQQFDLLNPTAPTKTVATFTTSRILVTSLTLIGNALYAADGDSSIEAFDISIPAVPRLIGSIAAPVAINVVRSTNGKLYASSGLLNTYIFSGSGASMTNAGTASFGLASLAPLSGDVAFVAANDRRLRAVDFSVTSSPVEVFRADVPPTNGTINRISAIATANNRVYVAAGDIGILSYDINGFIAPFAMRAYSSGGGSSVFFLSTNVADRVYIGRDSGGITEFTQSSNGGLTQARSWDGSRSDTVWDGNNGFLLASSGPSMTMWTVLSSTPQIIGSTTFRQPVVSAVLAGTVGYAVLADNSLWSADFAQGTVTPKQITAGSGDLHAQLARSGSGVLLVDVRPEGVTDLYFYAAGDFAQLTKSASLAGVPVTRSTLSGTTAAVLTFSGITTEDFSAGTARVLPQSTGLARGLFLNGTTLLELTDTSLLVWNTQSQKLTNQFVLPADPVALHENPAGTIVDLVTTTGVATVALNSPSILPTSIATPNSNAYYRKIATGAGRIDLFDGRSNADIYVDTLRYVNSLRPIGDIAANDNGVFTMSGATTVSAYNADGLLRGSQTIAVANSRPLGIFAVGDAVWVSIESGCPACIHTTYVFDPRNGMAQTMTFNGGVLDVVTSGTRAYAITDLPSEIRVMNISDPFHPSPIVTAGTDPQNAIAYANGTIYAFGNTLSAYSESTLMKLGDILATQAADPTGTITVADRHLRIDGNCALVTGLAFSPSLFNIVGPATWTAATAFVLGSPARWIAAQPGVFQILTDHSLETWSIKPLPKPPRREPAR